LSPSESPSKVPLDLARLLVDALEAKKADDIVLMDLTDVCSFADYFVVASGASERTLEALANDTVRQIKRTQASGRPAVEGSAASGWILIDAGDVVVHLFSASQRKYYRLEELWKAGKVVVHLQ
jgi:ribosome-associated protein